MYKIGLIVLLGATLFLLGAALSQKWLGKTKSENTVEIKVEKDRLYAHVQFLTARVPARNAFNLTSLNESAAYIYSQFQKLSPRVTYQTFKVNGNEYKNIVCSLGPENGDRVVVGAHYDVCGDQPGADDNASGVAGLLEIARLVQAREKDLKYRIDFVSFALEEPPFLKPTTWAVPYTPNLWPRPAYS